MSKKVNQNSYHIESDSQTLKKGESSSISIETYNAPCNLDMVQEQLSETKQIHKHDDNTIPLQSNLNDKYLFTNEDIQESCKNYNEFPDCRSGSQTPNHIEESQSLALKLDLNITKSTVSLPHGTEEENDDCKINKSFSKSAENILNIDQNLNDIKSLNTSSVELDKEKIINNFTDQKLKASATQKIPLDLTQSYKDIISRNPKEILNQDLGSIVKNVHGIFSSVSGSLKNAYHYTPKVTTAKPTLKIEKPIINDKVINDIFEEAVKLDTTNSDIVSKNYNDLECSSYNSVYSESDSTDLDHETKNVMKSQIESLENILKEQQKENLLLCERVRQQNDRLQEKDQAFKDLEAKLELMSKQVEQAVKEKNAAVMRYASVECSAIEAKRAAEAAAAKEKSAHSEVMLLNNKLKTAHHEKQRICQLYDDKNHEYQNSEREVAKLREDLKELEGRLKWTQSKLRMEMDAYKETADKADKLTHQVSELETAKQEAVANSTESAKAKQLETELKEIQAVLILCRHEKEELDRRLSSLTQQFENCTKVRDTATEALATANIEIENLKMSNLRLGEEAAELAALRAQAALADTLSAQLQRETERASQAEESLTRERARADTCARREAAALEHSARLTAQHVAERAKAGDHQAKSQALSVDNASLRTSLSAKEAECSKLEFALKEESERRNRENKTLARKVAELTEEVGELTKQLEWEKGDNGVLKKKHASAVKELNRELHRAMKRCEQLESKMMTSPDVDSTRTGSVSSLSSAESAHQEERLQNGHGEKLPEIQVREPDRQTLIERIVSLQRAAARRSERCEFLEEHSKQLTKELKNKSKLLSHMLASAPAGALASSKSDTNKKEIALLGGGAMAALWGGDPNGMTLSLSLEMNKKLQAVLEDTLLKNITLKENIDTLGEEIARLKHPKNPDTK